MTDATPRPGHDRDAIEELAELLPAPANRDLPTERHLHHKDILMRQIDRDRARDRTPARRRVLRPAVLAPVTALALAGALTVGLAVAGEGGTGAKAVPQAQGTAAAHGATALLGRISEVALATGTTPVRDDQFVYVKSKGRNGDQTSGKVVTGPLEDREVWLSQRPGPVKRLGVIREHGETLPINPELGDENGTEPGLHRPTYRFLASLPTDPDALLKYLYAHTTETAGKERDQAVFQTIGSLVSEQIVPPKQAAALYRAAARIPGVTEAPRAHDAIGRHGVGIARTDTRYGERAEWVFDADDLSFLGSRTYLTEDGPLGKAGTLLSSAAVLERAVVDKSGAEPTAAQVRTGTTEQPETRKG
ncbi:CU044_5270 family protein [Streptomyces sp. Ru73]|uniref:CU044_5270 family protein n=1 Tax=Streptomyces sp. Ru73 TaxID=2080748 RepID=UPI0021563FE1|nr:CU044_5270 family protein [Streptomyces sp. Ru73]